MSARVRSQIYIELARGLGDPWPGAHLRLRPLGTINAGGITPTGSVTFRSKQLESELQQQSDAQVQIDQTFARGAKRKWTV
ncbi:hypothetical protein T12_8849 [Trichinella patagoniensis]|uniref:Uncharacterized protein n=1 Tax=Trichinella patagoniensis TaxID=990121 RepID=A0A0V0ZWI4_9BILA|nr:hypothetical protein T12_8849 [Trichinella patagoniensis]